MENITYITVTPEELIGYIMMSALLAAVFFWMLTIAFDSIVRIENKAIDKIVAKGKYKRNTILFGKFAFWSVILVIGLIGLPKYL